MRIAIPSLAIAALGFGGCAQSPQQLAGAHSKEYFPSSVYGPASRRVVADGQPIPHGGGQYLVGKPYTVAGQTYYPSERKITQVGLASWYGDAFHGRLTANGEVYDRDGFTAAHPTMPLPSYARVTNLRNNYSMIVRVNDRGPYHSNRIMDVSRRVAESLDFKRGGTAQIKVEYVGRASLAGSDNAKLYATLRTDGPARFQGVEQPTPVIAEVAPPSARVASLAPYAPPAGHVRAIAESERPAALRPYAMTRSPQKAVAIHEAPSRGPHPIPDETASETHKARLSDKSLERQTVSHRGEPPHFLRMASHEERGADAHAFAPREVTLRPGRAADKDAKKGAPAPSAHVAKGALHMIAMPPVRPGHTQSEHATAARHATAGPHVGLRMSRSRDD